MKLDGIIPLYKKLKSSDRTYGVFKFTKNKIDFDIFFDIGITPYKIGFLVMNSNFQLWLKVLPGFNIDPFLKKAELNSLINVLNLKFDPDNKFSTKKFFEEFNSKIPNDFRFVKKQELPKLVNYVYEIEESEKIYYKGIIDWGKVNNGNNRQESNLEKTRLLYPKLYEQIKDRNISVRYSPTKNDEKEKEIE